MSAYQDDLNDYAYELWAGRDEMDTDRWREDLAEQGIWLAQTGPIYITDMTTSHIENCLNFIKGTKNEKVYTPLLKAELKRRGEN